MKAKKVSALLVATAMVCGIAGGTTAVHADPEYTIKLCTEQTDGDPIDEGCDKWAELVDEERLLLTWQQCVQKAARLYAPERSGSQLQIRMFINMKNGKMLSGHKI